MDEAFTTASKSGTVVNFIRGLVGAVLGGVAGYFLFGWILRQGIYAGIVPGALVGLGCGVFVQQRSILLGVVCGLASLALGVFTEWKHLPFARDDSFAYFLAHLFDLPPIKLIMLGLGGFAGFWFAFGTSRAKGGQAKE